MSSVAHRIDTSSTESQAERAHRRGGGFEGALSHDAEVFSTVRVREEAGGIEAYTLVLPAETDATHGLISTESPVGRALLGRGRGDEIEVQTPGGVRRLTVVEVSAPVPPIHGVSPRRSLR